MDHDLIIIGGGAGGLGAARAARWAGADVLVVSDGPLGGDCTFTGCVPSKTLLAAARDGLGFPEAMERVAATVARIAATETADVLRAEGIAVIEGRARFTTHDTIAIGDRRLTAPRSIVATGSRPLVAPIPGIDDIEVMTNEDVFSLTEAPASIGIIGAGPIGCELSQAFVALGVPVSLFELRPRVLPREEPDASAVVDTSLRAAGVSVHTGSSVERLERRADGIAVVTTEGVTVVERLLVAVGRIPNSANMGLEDLGVEFDDRGHIVTDDLLQTRVRGIYGAGDVTGRLPFTHAADEMGRLAAGNALRKGLRGRFRTAWIPMVTFTDPEVARIGMTESESATCGGWVAELPMAEMDRAITDGRTEGFIKLIAGPRAVTRRAFGGRVLGATIVAPRAGEMIHEIAVAMRTKAFTGRLAQTVHAYPTWSYGIQKTAGQFFGEVEGRTARRARS